METCIRRYFKPIPVASTALAGPRHMFSMNSIDPSPVGWENVFDSNDFEKVIDWSTRCMNSSYIGVGAIADL
jgi:hypothetical protein